MRIFNYKFDEMTQDRQDKWQTTLKSKPDEEISRINRAKVANSFTSGYSKVSQELFWKLYNTHLKGVYSIDDVYFATFDENGGRTDGVNYEYGLVTNNKRFRLLDFYVESLNRCIEFDGDYWHERYDGNKQRDAEREVEVIDKLGCPILHIKEHEYRKDPDREVLKCLEFLNGGREDNPDQGVG